jgi:hypothetical protein
VSDFRADHQGAVFNAVNEMGELQERLAMATEQCNVALGAIAACVGATDVASGQNALAYIAGCKDRIEELFGVVQQAVEEMSRYGRGF